MVPKVKATKRSKIQSVMQDYFEEFIKIPAINEIAICAGLRCLATNAFLLKVFGIRPNTKMR